jgi:hypothetical protein
LLSTPGQRRAMAKVRVVTKSLLSQYACVPFHRRVDQSRSRRLSSPLRCISLVR